MPITATPIAFADTPLRAAYSGFFALELSHVFTRAECDALVALAQGHDAAWEPAQVNNTGVDSSFRHSDRIMRDDADTAAAILDRIRPFLAEAGVCEIGPESPWAEAVIGRKLALHSWSKARGETGYWRLARLNPRLRFLRYGPGQYFKPHCDGRYDETASDPPQKSFLTIHLYLNDGGGDGGLQGGATRFWTPDKKHWLDVHPQAGRVLVFQQRMLVHSGEPVTGGVKVTMRTDCMFEKVVVGRGVAAGDQES